MHVRRDAAAMHISLLKKNTFVLICLAQAVAATAFVGQHHRRAVRKQALSEACTQQSVFTPFPKRSSSKATFLHGGEHFDSRMRGRGCRSTVLCSSLRPEPTQSFILRLDDEHKVRVIRDFLPSEESSLLIHQVPDLCAERLVNVGSRKTTVFFQEPTRDYLFSGRRFKADNVHMPADIKGVMLAAGDAAGQPFNGAVVNVYDTPDSQIKWHDDGEYTVGPVVASYSLGRSATMGFRPKLSKKRKSKWGNKSGNPEYIHGKKFVEPLPDSPSSSSHDDADLPVVDAEADAAGVVSLEVFHNTLVVMEAGVQDYFEHRIFKPHPTGAEIDPRINLTFHVHR
jgi:alkylated DNA repair dioxygenase AlkB